MLQSEEHERGISPVEGSDPKSFQQPCSEGAFAVWPQSGSSVLRAAAQVQTRRQHLTQPGRGALYLLSILLYFCWEGLSFVIFCKSLLSDDRFSQYNKELRIKFKYILVFLGHR